MAPFINVPENEKKFFEFNRQDSEGQVVMPFETFRFSGGRPPNWKFIRIQDFYLHKAHLLMMQFH